MENNEVSKSNKIKIIVITALIFLVSIAGISYAYFTIQITGNETASSMRLRTANMSLIYNDVQIVSDEYAIPGWSDTKTLTVTNTGNVTADYIIKFRELVNTIINGELVISAECSASSGTCADLPERAVHAASSEITDAYMYGPISIAPGVTHTYTLTAEFIETGSNQNYNQNKYFNGTLNIGDGTATSEELFEYTVSNNEVTITAYKTMDVVISDQSACESTGTYMLQQDPYNMDSFSAAYAAGVLCSGGKVEGMSIADQVYLGAIAPEYYSALGLSVTPLNNVLTDVIIPSTIDGKAVTKIGDYSFVNRNLTSVVFPNSVTEIGRDAFASNLLTSVVIPSSVTTIGKNVFMYNQLTSIVIPNSVTLLGWCSFMNNQLISAVISNNITYIDEDTFENNHLTMIVIPDGVTWIGMAAFRTNQLASVTIPSSVTGIGWYAFQGNQLTSIVIPSGVTEIYDYAFEDNKLVSVVIPSSVMTIDNSAFSNNQLTLVTIQGKSSSSDFYSYPESSPWGWASGSGCTDATCITWLGSGS